MFNVILIIKYTLTAAWIFVHAISAILYIVAPQVGRHALIVGRFTGELIFGTGENRLRGSPEKQQYPEEEGFYHEQSIPGQARSPIHVQVDSMSLQNN